MPPVRPSLSSDGICGRLRRMRMAWPFSSGNRLTSPMMAPPLARIASTSIGPVGRTPATPCRRGGTGPPASARQRKTSRADRRCRAAPRRKPPGFFFVGGSPLPVRRLRRCGFWRLPRRRFRCRWRGLRRLRAAASAARRGQRRFRRLVARSSQAPAPSLRRGRAFSGSGCAPAPSRRAACSDAGAAFSVPSAPGRLAGLDRDLGLLGDRL